MKKLLCYVIWISGIIGIVFILMGTLALIFKTSILGVNHYVNYFHVANSFMLVAIGSLIYKRVLSEEK